MTRCRCRSTSSPVHGEAFTLIELLVVISVISLLVAILLPALAGARQQAQRTVCLSQTRQIMLGALMYANDSKGKLPSNLNNSTSAIGVADQPWNLGWGAGEPFRLYGLCVSYVQYAGFFCPANSNTTYANRKVWTNQVNGVGVTGVNSARGGYMYRFIRENGGTANGVISSEGPYIPVAPLDLGQRFATANAFLGYGAGYRLPPSKTSLLGDVTLGYRSNPYNPGIVAEVHQIGGNAAFYDGHGAFRTIEPLDQYSSTYFSNDYRVAWGAFLFMYDLR